MLRFQLISDVHGVFDRVEWDEEADFVLCAGDVSENLPAAMEFLKQSPTPVIYTPGNHEFYNGRIKKGRKTYIAPYHERLDFLREECDKTNGHITLADNEVFQIEDVRIIASTLWTDFNKIHPILSTVAEESMNDYAHISTDLFFEKRPDLWDKYKEAVETYKNNVRAVLRGNNHYNKQIIMKSLTYLQNKYKLGHTNIKEMLDSMPFEQRMNNFNPLISSILYQENLEFLENSLSNYHSGKTIVMTHHAPTYTALSMNRYAVDFKSVSMEPLLKRSINTNKIGAYANQLETLASKYNIDAWVHGHLHERMLYRLGNASVHCNASGNNSNTDSRRGFKSYSFYLDKETKLKATINSVKHAKYLTKKVNGFLMHVIDHDLLHIFEDIQRLRAIHKENYVLINTLRTLPRDEIRADVNEFKNFSEISQGENDVVKIIHKIISQNNQMFIQLDLWYQELLKEVQ